jgi:hypothetical protein
MTDFARRCSNGYASSGARLFLHGATTSAGDIGPVAEGIRVNFHAAGGRVNGPKIVGLVRAVGADWLTVRSDGVGIRDACATFETDEGTLLFRAYSGMTDHGEPGYRRFLDAQVGSVLSIARSAGASAPPICRRSRSATMFTR